MKKYLAFALLLGACVTEEPGVTGTQSLRVDLIGPADPGTPEVPLPDDARTITVKVSAIDEKNEIDQTFDGDVEVYAQFLGTLTPSLQDAPLATISLSGGQSAQTTVDLPPVYGPTLLWIQDGLRSDATFATGTSPVLWYRDPHMADISTPDDENALDALSSSPLENKQVTVDSTRYGANGHLMVTSVFAQGYTLSDVECSSSPCTSGAYDHVTIFSFSKPKDQHGNLVQVGEFIDGFAGAVEEFNGLTEIGFPQTFASENPTVDASKIPLPTKVMASWLTDPIQFERVESALVEIDGATLCPLDDDYTSYSQWKLDIGAGCGSPINVITAGVVPFDPSTVVGMTVPKVIGTLRPVNIGSFNVWIVFPRSAADLTLP